MEVGFLLIHEKRVRDPNLLEEFRAHAQRLHFLGSVENEAGILPHLSEVKVKREVLAG